MFFSTMGGITGAIEFHIAFEKTALLGLIIQTFRKEREPEFLSVVGISTRAIIEETPFLYRRLYA